MRRVRVGASSAKGACISAALICTAAVSSVPQTVCAQSTIIPTDTLSLPGRHKGPSYLKLNSSELKLLEKLPPKLYINFTNEASFRLETNPFQTPTRQRVIQSIIDGSPSPTSVAGATSPSGPVTAARSVDPARDARDVRDPTRRDPVFRSPIVRDPVPTDPHSDTGSFHKDLREVEQFVRSHFSSFDFKEIGKLEKLLRLFGIHLTLRDVERLAALLLSDTDSDIRAGAAPDIHSAPKEYLKHTHYTRDKSVPRYQPYSDAQQLSHVYDAQQVFREEPNLTIGWQFTPKLSVYSNYFLIRDVLMKSSSLNSTTQSLGGGMQYDYTFGKGYDLQPNLQFREMWQTGQPRVFDYLPAITLTKQVGQATSVYINSQLQLRGRQPFVSPTAEIDHFQTAGLQTQRGRWQGSASCTFTQNFRNIFGRDAVLPANNYGFICDFELDRQLFQKYQGLQAFVRAEPLWNFHSKYTVGLSGFDFRLFYGLKLAVAKPALTGAVDSIRQQLLKSEGP